MLTHRDVLRRCASAYGARVALTGPGGMVLDYEALDAETDRLADGLQRHGFGPGDAMIWIDYNSVEFLVAYYATAKLGMTFSPMNYWLRPHELAPLGELVRPSVVVAGHDHLGVAREAFADQGVRLWVALGDGDPSGCVPWAELVDGPSTPIDVEIDETMVHEILFTSGTTGQAKGVMRSQRARILDSFGAALAYGLQRDDHMLWFLPQFHIGGGSVPGQLLVQGGRVTILRRFDEADAARAIAEGVTYMVGVPAHYNLLFESGALQGVDTSAVRGCYVGGSVASRRVFEQIMAHFPQAEIVHGYGSTESGPHTLAVRGQAFLDHFGALGLPVPGTEVRVVDVTTREVVGPGEVGELCVRSESIMLGYLGRPDLTAAALDDGWLRTGDLVRRADDGYFHLVDRAKDMIITGGENVYAKEVEDVLAAHPSVAEVAVIGVPDDVYEERVVAIVRADPAATAPPAHELIAFARQQLAGFKCPKEVHFVDDFPRTGIGKIAKQELRVEHGAAGDRDR